MFIDAHFGMLPVDAFQKEGKRLKRLHGGGKGGGGDPIMSYYLANQAAEAQAKAGKEIATNVTYSNRPNINTPWGSQTWNATGGTDPATGLPVTNWEQNIKLSPEEQSALDAQQRIQTGRSGAAETLLGQATGAFQKPFDWGAMPAVPGSVGEAQKGAFDVMSQSLQPGRQQREQALDTQLANMGLPRDSEAWRREKANLSEQFAQQDKGLLSSAMSEGRADIGAQQGLRTAAVAEEAQRRGMPLNELNALLTGQQVNMPQGMQAPPTSNASSWAPPNYMAAFQMSNPFAPKQGGGMDWGSAIGGIASAAAAFSDRRLKSNIRRVGTHPIGVGIYEYDLFGRRERGVIAQELLNVRPDLVSTHSSGFLMVNYGGL